ncbi:hypothetical protein BJ684DRAFT_17482, partial [Piptocephalis cylindrospora]
MSSLASFEDPEAIGSLEITRELQHSSPASMNEPGPVTPKEDSGHVGNTTQESHPSPSTADKRDVPLPGKVVPPRSKILQNVNESSPQDIPTLQEDTDTLGTLLTILDGELERVSLYYDTTERSMQKTLSLLSHYLEEKEGKLDLSSLPTLQTDRREIRR